MSQWHFRLPPRAYVAFGLPDRFHKHMITMDSALAARLKAIKT